MKNLIKRNVSFIIVFAIVLSAAAMCFSVPGSAASALKEKQKLLAEYITELYLKGPTVSSSVRENLIDKGLGTDDLFGKRAEYDLRLCSSDEYNGYYFTDKEKFLQAFGESGLVFLDDIYVWYPSVSAAKKAGTGISQNNSLIKYNISNALNFAIDVYGYCSEDKSELFSDRFNSSRKDLATFAIDCIYKIIVALEKQIGDGTDKPTYYRNDFSETFCSPESGLYPYFDVRFKKNTPVMTGYLDTSAYKEKTHDYATLKESIDISAAITAFETAYSNLHSKKNEGVLYYDFLESFDNVRHCYDNLCTYVLRSEVPNPDIAEKAKIYLKLKSLGEIFSKYILPYADAYSSDLSAMSINYTTIKTLIYFVGDNPYFLHSIKLEAMNDLADNFSQSISRLAPVEEYALTAEVVSDNKIDAAKLKSYIDKFKGVVGDDNASLYERADNTIEKLSNISSSVVSISVPVTYFYGSNGEKTAGDSFIFNIVPSLPLYTGLINEAKMYCLKISEQIDSSIPEVLNPEKKEILPIKDLLNGYSFIFGSCIPVIGPESDIPREVDFSYSASAILRKLLGSTWGTDSPDEGRIFDLDTLFNAAAEFYAYKNGTSSGYLNSEKTLSVAEFKDYLSDSNTLYEILKKAIPLIEKDASVYSLSVNYKVQNVAEYWKLSKDPSTGIYSIVSDATAADGINHINPYNYKTGALTNMTREANNTFITLNNGSTPAKVFIADEKFTNTVRDLLSSYGSEMLDSFEEAVSAQSFSYYGKDSMAYEIFRTMLLSKGISIDRYITLDTNGRVPENEPVYKYFAFTVSAVSGDSERAVNDYSFEDNRLMENLITPLDVIIRNRVDYIGNYDDVFAERITGFMNTAQMLVASVNADSREVGYEITVQDAEELHSALGEVNFTLANHTLAYIASHKASTLDALIDRAKAKTIDQSDTTPYYMLLWDRFQRAYDKTLSVNFNKTIPVTDIDEIAETLSKLFSAIEEYEKAVQGNMITLKDLETRISEAELLFARYDIETPNTYFSDLKKAIEDAKTEYSERLSTFTAEDLRYEVKKLETAMTQARNSVIVDELMKNEIAKLTVSVKSYSDYTQESWDAYSAALQRANLAAANGTEKVSVCNERMEALRAAVSGLMANVEEPEDEKPEEPENEQNPEPAEPEPDNSDTEPDNKEFFDQANAFYEKSVKELAEYTLSSNANKEKIEAWSVALSGLKAAIDEGKDQETVVSSIISLQLTKEMKIENPETIDD